jgi:hypothetical protein
VRLTIAYNGGVPIEASIFGLAMLRIKAQTGQPDTVADPHPVAILVRGIWCAKQTTQRARARVRVRMVVRATIRGPVVSDVITRAAEARVQTDSAVITILAIARVASQATSNRRDRLVPVQAAISRHSMLAVSAETFRPIVSAFPHPAARLVDAPSVAERISSRSMSDLRGEESRVPSSDALFDAIHGQQGKGL